MRSSRSHSHGWSVITPQTGRAVRRGDTVRVVGMPAAADALPAEAKAVFAAVIGRVLRVDDVDCDTGCVAVNVHADGSQADDWCHHTLWVDPQCVLAVSGMAAAATRT